MSMNNIPSNQFSFVDALSDTCFLKGNLRQLLQLFVFFSDGMVCAANMHFFTEYCQKGIMSFLMQQVARLKMIITKHMESWFTPGGSQILIIKALDGLL